MSLTTKEHLSLILQTIKKLLSFKADKSEFDANAKAVASALDQKVDRSEIEDSDAVELAIEMELISPVAADDGAIYTDENGVLYSL